MRLGTFLLENRYYAAILACASCLFSLLGLPFVGIVALLIVSLVTLRKGPLPGLWVLVWASLPATALAFTGNVSLFISQVLMSLLIVWVFSAVLFRYDQWGKVLEVAALIGGMAVLVVHALKPDILTIWHGMIENYFKVLGETANINTLPVDKLATLVDYLSHIATGLQAVFVTVSNLLVLFLARWWQARLFNPGGLQQECYSVRLGHATTWFLIVNFAAALFGQQLAIDLLPVLVLPFVFAGLSTVLSVSQGMQKRVIWLGIIYLALFFMMPYVCIMLALIGWSDSYFDYRRRFKDRQLKR